MARRQPHHVNVQPVYVRPDVHRADFEAMTRGAHSSVRRRGAAIGALHGAVANTALMAAALHHVGAGLRDISPHHAAAFVAGGALAGGTLGALRGHLYGGGIRASMVRALANSTYARETGHANMAAHLAMVQAAKHRRRIHGKFA